MPKLVNFRNHPIVRKKREACYEAKSCPLIDKNITLPTCGGYEGGECPDCDVPKYFEEARTSLTRLALTGSM